MVDNRLGVFRSENGFESLAHGIITERSEGGGRVNFMYFKYNFSLDTAKRMLRPFVHISFPIRVFWLR